jgi:hypothetical protein
VGAHGQPTPHTWIRLEQDALDRLARFAKMAVDAGVAERQIRIAERTGMRIAAALDEAVTPLELSTGERSAMVQRFVQGSPCWSRPMTKPEDPGAAITINADERG